MPRWRTALRLPRRATAELPRDGRIRAEDLLDPQQ
jgi:hypothetical protein